MVAECSEPIEGSAEPDDLADDDDRGRLDPGRKGRDLGQCRHHDALLCGRRLADHSDGLLGPAAAHHQPRSDTRQMPRSHVEHENRGALGDCRQSSPPGTSPSLSWPVRKVTAALVS